MNKKQVFLFAGLVIVLSSCIRYFVPDIPVDTELLVVDGNINDGPGPYTIKLSKSTRLQELSRFVPYLSCKVQLEDNVGNNVTLTEKGKGVYQTD